MAGFLLSGSESGSALVSVPVALDGVDWSELEATHRGNDAWVDSDLPGLLGLEVTDPSVPAVAGATTVDYRLPDSLQTTSASIAVTAPDNAQAEALAREAADRLVEHTNEVNEATYGRARAAVQARVDKAAEELATIRSNLDTMRADQQKLIDAKAGEAKLAKVTGDIWAAETERVEWEREANSALVELNKLDADHEGNRPTLEILGDPRLEQSVGRRGAWAAALSGCLVGLWVAAIGVYWHQLRRGRIHGANHPTLNTLGVSVTDLSGYRGGIDTASTMAVGEAISGGGVPVSLVDCGRTGAAQALALVLSEGIEVDERLLVPVPLGSDESEMIGTLAILIAVVGETRIDALLARYTRCQALEVPVVRIVLIDTESLGHVNDWAAPALATW